MKKVKLFIIFLMLCNITLYSQSNNPDIEMMYKSIAINPLKYHTIDYDSIKLKEGSKYDTIIIQDNPEICFLHARKLNSEPPYDYDRIILNKQSYIMEQLLFYDCDSLLKKDESEPIRYNYAAGYTFCFHKTHYLSLFFWNPQISSSTPHFFIFLANLSQPDKRPIMLSEQASFTPNCFGDFNGDGKLDFLLWYYGYLYEPRMSIFSLENNDFVIDEKHYLIIDEDNGDYHVNYKKSKWFH